MESQEITEKTNFILFNCEKENRVPTQIEESILELRIKRLRELTEYNTREIIWIQQHQRGEHIKKSAG
jgi:hypothetical protein